METCLAGADEWRGGDGPLVLERGPADNPLFGAFFQAAQDAGYPLDRRRQRLPPGGVREVRPQPAPGSPALRGPGLPPPGAAPQEPHRPHPVARHRRPLPGHPRGGCRLPTRGAPEPSGRRRRDHPVRRGDQHPPAAAALGCRRRRRPPGSRHRRGDRPARCRRQPPGPPRGLRPARLEAAGLDRAGSAVARSAQDRLRVAGPPPWPRRDQPLRGRRLRPQQRRGRLPEPDVPLPPGRDPLRRERAVGGTRLPGAHRPHVRRHPRPREDPLDRPRASTPRCCSTTCRPPTTARSGSRPSGSPATS